MVRVSEKPTPLLTYVTGGFTLLGVDSWYFYKLYPPVVMGARSLTSATVTYEVSKSRTLALATAPAVSFNPYVVGQSQQWHQRVLGVLLLLLYTLSLHRKSSSKTRAVVLTLLAASYEIGGVIALFASIYEVFTSKTSKSRVLFTATLLVSLLLLAYYAKVPEQPVLALTREGVHVAGILRYRIQSSTH